MAEKCVVGGVWRAETGLLLGQGHRDVFPKRAVQVCCPPTMIRGWSHTQSAWGLISPCQRRGSDLSQEGEAWGNHGEVSLDFIPKESHKGPDVIHGSGEGRSCKFSDRNADSH